MFHIRNMSTNSTDCQVAIIGAGPYGLSAASYLKAAGFEPRIFGEPMSFWKDYMPTGMFLRSSWSASHIADPDRAFTLDSYRSRNGTHIPAPVPLERFIEYGCWYQQRLVPELDRRRVARVEQASAGLLVTLADGERFSAQRVVVASGIRPFVFRPPEFAGIPRDLASHSSEHTNLKTFSKKRLAVVGGGQSALESAALLHEAGADVELIARRPQLNWVGGHAWLHHLGPLSRALYSPADVGPAVLSRMVATPHFFRRFPRKMQDRAAYRAIRPAGAAWLTPRLSRVRMSLGRKIISVTPGNNLQLRLDDGTERAVDHAILATGYKVDVSRYDFLDGTLTAKIRTVGGFPVLGRGFESSVAGLHFLGKPASWSFGPLLSFVSGTEFAARELVQMLGTHKNGHRNGNHVH